MSEWTPPVCAGLVAVLAHDPAWSPRSFRPLYFAEFGNDTHRIAGTAPLLVAVLPMPYSTTAQRRALCDELISGYNPIWQTKPAMVKLFSMSPDPPRRPIGFMPMPVPATDAR
jgi:hypothetical protein